MIMRDLTSRQRDILSMILRHIEEHGFPPTVREIGEACGLKSPRSVSQHLATLEKKGYIRRRKDKSRAIEVMGRDREEWGREIHITLPLVGTIPAGDPAVASEEWEEVHSVDEGLFGDREAFLLRARGDSMTGAHIMDGDLLVVAPGESARDGEIVAALIGEDATVKRLRRSGDDLFLVPENPAMEPIRLDPENGSIRIVGRVIGLIRRIG